jgi:hypothetical protein
VVALLGLTACLDTPAAPPTTEADQPAIAACDFPRYRCYPNRPGSDRVCEFACGYSGYCRDYSSREYIWCEVHPGSCLSGFRCCDTWGNPTWDTVCVVGPRP